MIHPDTKDWTWVLQRPCPDCGFDATAAAANDVAELVRANGREWQLQLAAGVIKAGRPNEHTWSSLEYACHGRDVYRRYDERIMLMLAEEDPLFANWDQDATALEDRYEQQDPAVVVAELVAAADAVAGRLERITDRQWSRPGRRSDGASFTIASLALYMVHDPIHHIWDVTSSAQPG